MRNLHICSGRRFFIFTIVTVFSMAVFATSPPKLQLANSYHDGIKLQNYWVSEKLDGVRAYWDGTQLVTRQGKGIHAPHWFIQDFPKDKLDGELWIARQQFELVSGVVRQQVPKDEQWHKVKYMIFDLPDSIDPFFKRILQMKALVEKTKLSQLQMIPQYQVASTDELMQHLTQIVKEGGEGLMLHKGDSLYRAVRNDDLLKLKTYQDAEAIVIAYVPGKGKYVGKMGALLVETKDHIQFKIGSGFTEEQRQHPPDIGSVITYQYVGKTKNNIPRFATFMRIRES